MIAQSAVATANNIGVMMVTLSRRASTAAAGKGPHQTNRSLGDFPVDGGYRPASDDGRGRHSSVSFQGDGGSMEAVVIRTAGPQFEVAPNHGRRASVRVALMPAMGHAL
jgi:hypothetical protein